MYNFIDKTTRDQIEALRAYLYDPSAEARALLKQHFTKRQIRSINERRDELAAIAGIK